MVMTILIFSEPNDVHAQSVVRELARMGESDVRILDFRDVPQRISVEMAMSNARGSGFALGMPDGRRLRLEEVRSFWWRRPQSFMLPEGMDPQAQHFALSELATAFQGMWQSSETLWVNNIVRDAAAAHKPWQLELARRIGLSIPDTLMTTDPEAVRAFWEARGGEVIYKPFLQTFHSWRETRQLKHEELAQLDSVRIAPVIFQSLVPGVADLRVTIIGSSIFAAAVDLRKMEYKLDVRLNQQAYERHDLPADVSQKLLMLMRRLGLEYGAIDLRLTPDGEYVFFEVNPAGQFLFVEHACRLPISAALASHLASGGAAAAAEPEVMAA
jgi:glutathione synthase/RimK-type ligase-like ATP-grasp enzyme